MMRLSRMRFTIGGLMALAAATALLIATIREDSRPLVGIVLVTGCASCLAYKLAAERLASRRAAGVETSLSRRVGIVAASSAIAVAVLGAADLAFLAAYWGYMLATFILGGPTHFVPSWEPGHILMGAVLGGIVAIPHCLPGKPPDPESDADFGEVYRARRRGEASRIDDS